jgi:carbon-monoxide dehydrogenase medium subunit
LAELFVPSTLEAAVERLSSDPRARPLAGGVGVLLARALGAATPERWVAVGALDELRELGLDGDRIVLGAGTTIEELAEPNTGVSVPGLLRAAATSVGNPGIRAVATLGGNVVAGGAASDLVAALVALGAEAEMVGPGGIRHVPVEVLASGGPPLRDELVRAFRVPAAATRLGWQRLALRGAMDRSSATVAVALGSAGARVAVTFVANRPLRLPSVEADPSPASARRAAARDVEALELFGDDRASVVYRRRVIPVLVERAVSAAFAMAPP